MRAWTDGEGEEAGSVREVGKRKNKENNIVCKSRFFADHQRKRLFMVINYIVEILLDLFYISNEGLAILKNINKLGVPLPQILAKMLKQIRDRE